MATITVTLPEGATACNGKQVTFRAPCNCTGVTGIIIDGATYGLVDTSDISISTVGRVFTEGSMVSVVLDTENSKAYIQNPATENFVVNAVSSDGNNYTVDKTFQEITEAINLGKFVYLNDNSGTLPRTYLLENYDSNSGFLRFTRNYSYTIREIQISSDSTVTFSESQTTPIVYSASLPDSPEAGVIYAVPI